MCFSLVSAVACFSYAWHGSFSLVCFGYTDADGLVYFRCDDVGGLVYCRRWACFSYADADGLVYLVSLVPRHALAETKKKSHMLRCAMRVWFSSVRDCRAWFSSVSGLAQCVGLL